ncbi:MAG TPA: alkyl hydroperoxide reductase subunit F [Gammaproteobacteria bacterium]|nr:alkyl hydroperoxide reductase subunit F [Gammaproteobacteria bacterium]
MLDANLKGQLQNYLGRVTLPVEITASLDDSPKSAEMRAFLEEIVSLSPLLSLSLDGTAERRPSFRIARAGTAMRVEFACLPLGHEFTSLVLALLQAGGHPPKVDEETIARIEALAQDLTFEVYVSLSCHNCPDVVQAVNLMAVLNPRVKALTIDGALFQSEVEARQVLAVPSIYLNGEFLGSGRMEIGELLAKVDTGSTERDAKRLAAKLPYDMLVVGGGPAGAAAAIYAARKGIRTGLIAERFGGQTLDTLAIENFISVPETEGPKFAAALEQHVRVYDVDIMNLQRAVDLIPASESGDLHEVRLANGASLFARSVVLSTGARWREVNVPGEREYRNRGVAYCPHCDGPLFKGKRVAVIGGGNSGVEAAIDLAGVVAHVTVLEFLPTLKADAVLVRKLESLPNVTVITNARTTAITGDGQRVNGLDYQDRESGDDQHIALAGVFVQIGLIPNTEWLRGVVELSPYGEIEVDRKGATSVPGIYAAGDVTTVPYKQIVIAVGEGAKAALGAFDHLIRSSAPAAAESVAASEA